MRLTIFLCGLLLAALAYGFHDQGTPWLFVLSALSSAMCFCYLADQWALASIDDTLTIDEEDL